jgi:hypothetical protein
MKWACFDHNGRQVFGSGRLPQRHLHDNASRRGQGHEGGKKDAREQRTAARALFHP